jgi:hypothetical protein
MSLSSFKFERSQSCCYCVQEINDYLTLEHVDTRADYGCRQMGQARHLPPRVRNKIEIKKKKDCVNLCRLEDKISGACSKNERRDK